jgi:hypothetical protein
VRHDPDLAAHDLARVKKLIQAGKQQWLDAGALEALAVATNVRIKYKMVGRAAKTLPPVASEPEAGE